LGSQGSAMKRREGRKALGSRRDLAQRLRRKTTFGDQEWGGEKGTNGSWAGDSTGRVAKRGE